MWRKGVDLFAPLSDLDIDLQSLRSNRGGMMVACLIQESLYVFVCVCVCVPRGWKGGM